MIVKWMNLFGHKVFKEDKYKAKLLIGSLEYEIKATHGEGSAESLVQGKSRTLAYCINSVCGCYDSFIFPFYGLLIRRSAVTKHFCGDVDSGYNHQREVRTNPKKHIIKHEECFYSRNNAVYGIILVRPPRDYKYREEAMSLQGIIKLYALGHGLKVYEGGEEIIAASYN